MKIESLQLELEKAVSLVVTAKRLLNTGTMVDLAALEGRIAAICNQVGDVDKDMARTLVPYMEQLIADLDALDAAIRDRMDPEPGA